MEPAGGEMKAIIRLGLPRRVRFRRGSIWSGARVGVALGHVAVFAGHRAWCSNIRARPWPGNRSGGAGHRDGSQVREGGQSMGLMHSGTNKEAVTYQVGARVRWRPLRGCGNGYVTVNKVDVE